MVYKKLLEFEEDLDAAKKENLEDDSGYELDDSGMIPKLEELKAAGKNNETEETEKGILMNSDEVFSDEDILENPVEEDEDKFTTEEYDKFLFDEEEESPLEKDFQRSMIIEKDSIEEDEDDYEKIYDFSALDSLDDDNSLDKMKFFDSEDLSKKDVDDSYNIEDDGFFMEEETENEIEDFDEIKEDLSDLKIKFYDENESSSDRMADALERIANSLERIADILEIKS